MTQIKQLFKRNVGNLYTRRGAISKEWLPAVMNIET